MHYAKSVIRKWAIYWQRRQHSLLQLVGILLDWEQINLTFFTIYCRLEEVFICFFFFFPVFLSRDSWTPAGLRTLPLDKWLRGSSTWQVNKHLGAVALLPHKTHLSSERRQPPYVSAVRRRGEQVEGLIGWESNLDKPRETQELLLLLLFYWRLVGKKDTSRKLSVLTVKGAGPAEEEERGALKAHTVKCFSITIWWTCDLQQKSAWSETWIELNVQWKNKTNKRTFLVLPKWKFCRFLIIKKQLLQQQRQHL